MVGTVPSQPLSRICDSLGSHYSLCTPSMSALQGNPDLHLSESVMPWVI